MSERSHSFPWALLLLAGAGASLPGCFRDAAIEGGDRSARAAGDPAAKGVGAEARTSPAEVAWRTDFGAALKVARETGRPIVIDFYATWCGPCKLMDATTLKDERVLRRMQSFVPLKIDVDEEAAIAARFGIESIPTTVVLDPDGEVVTTAVGYLDADRFLEVLDEGDPPATGRGKKDG